MPRAAVLGSPIEHSLSPLLHNAGYRALGLDDWEYDRFQVAEAEMAAFVAGAGSEYRGFSVTMPGKFAALKIAGSASERARLIGCANTLVRTPEGWQADNTDTEGVLGALGELLDDAPVDRALLIGAGGTAATALWGLVQHGVREVTVLNRSDRLAQMRPLAEELGVSLRGASYDDDLDALSRAADCVVSTVPTQALRDHAGALSHAPVFDVSYDPWPSPLLAHAAADGYRTVGGHVMLAYQAFSQFEQFTGQPAPREAMFAALDTHLGKMRGN